SVCSRQWKCRASGPLLPDAADRAQLALDGPLDAPELRRDLGVGVPLHLPPGDGAQRLLLELVQQPPALVRHLTGERGAGFAAGDLLPAAASVGVARRAAERRLAADGAAAALPPLLVPHLLDRLAGRDRDQQRPESVAVAQVREAPLGRGAAEA